MADVDHESRPDGHNSAWREASVASAVEASRLAGKRPEAMLQQVPDDKLGLHVPIAKN
jgi:hypothetical protein